MKKTAMLFLLIFLEGYVVLAAELLAIRQIIPIAGSGADVISVVIAGVLMPLAFGYYYGGQYQKNNIRHKLSTNILSAGVILGLGLSPVIMEIGFSGLAVFGIDYYLAQVAVYVAVFLAYPVFLLGQTLPLVGRYFSHRQMASMAGRMLFFSTMGSFLGSVVTTVVLVALIGVQMTVIVLIGLLWLAAVLLSRPRYRRSVWGMAGVFSVVCGLAFWQWGGGVPIVQMAHMGGGPHAVHIKNMDTTRAGQAFQTYFIDPIKDGQLPPKNILVIGLGEDSLLATNDNHNHYVFVSAVSDDDGQGGVASARHVKNKTYKKQGIVKYLAENEGRKFDAILWTPYVQTHYGGRLDREVFDALPQMKSFLSDRGRLGIYVLGCTNRDKDWAFNVKLDRSLRYYFQFINRNVLNRAEVLSPDRPRCGRDIVYTYFNRGQQVGYEDTIYTDGRNRSFLDKSR